MSSRSGRCLLLAIALLILSDVGRFVWPRAIAVSQVVISSDGRVQYPAGLFQRPLLARLVIWSLDRRAALQPGLYTVSGRHSDRTVLRYLANPRHREVVVVFPEGFRAAEMAVRLERAGVTGAAEFLEAATMRPSYERLLPKAIRLAPQVSLEGLLFPDTYRFHPGSSAEAVVERLLRRFQAVTAELPISYERLMLASLVEREARADGERPIIAAIFLNRLRAGERLEADPSVVYGRDSAQLVAQPPEGWRFWAAPRPAELEADQPWNSYTRAGLPPTPIANPGTKSLEAALRPAETSARFFFHDREGQFVVSPTLLEHQRKLRGE